MEYALVRGKIQSGHGVASGKGKDERYPEGTLKQQFNYFLERGLDLSNYFMGTINLDISPCSYEIKKPKYCIIMIKPIKDWFICPIPKRKKIIFKSRPYSN